MAVQLAGCRASGNLNLAGHNPHLAGQPLAALPGSTDLVARGLVLLAGGDSRRLLVAVSHPAVLLRSPEVPFLRFRPMKDFRVRLSCQRAPLVEPQRRRMLGSASTNLRRLAVDCRPA